MTMAPREPDQAEMPLEGRSPAIEAEPGEAVPPLLTDMASRVLAVKEGDTFLYSGADGDLVDRPDRGHGLYHCDTRFLSRFVMRISGRRAVLLSSSWERGYLSHVDLTNPDLFDGDEVAVPQQTLNIRRVRAVNGRFFERVRLKNYNPFPVDLLLSFSLGADFADIFEVRGAGRVVRGRAQEPGAQEGRADFGHRGRDGTERRTVAEFEPMPERTVVRDGHVEVEWRLDLAPHQTRLVSIVVEPVIGAVRPAALSFDAAVNELRRSYENWERGCTTIISDNELFNQLLERSLRDLRTLYTAVDGGGVEAGGIPWFVAVFGRDSLMTAHQLLTVNSGLARDALRLLSKYQGEKVDPWRDEEPGKILHEIRRGELAGAGEIPHTPYYGSVDSTPLYVLLYAQLFRWTGDVKFAREILPNVRAALRWIDEYGDMDGDGFVEYLCRSPRGLTQQGWKDSFDAIVHQDGRLATGPVALAEVQAYVYAAKQRLAGVFEILGEPAEAARLRNEAAELKIRFNRQFWVEDEKYFALALDGDKRQVRTVTSNPAHGLYCGIIDDDKAEHVGRRLLQPDMFSGWGIRTMSKGAVPYNPMSYHNGSVWPHDNAFIAAGLKRYGFAKATNRVATALFDAAVHADYMRLPELFCGFTRRSPSQPVAYPVACSPQAWAAGSPFLMLQAILGISARAHENLVTVNQPHLPPWLNEVELRNLRVGESSISLVFRRRGEITSFSLLDRKGDVRVVMEE